MGSQKVSIKSQTSCSKLASFLRRVADELDAGTLCLGEIELHPQEAVEVQSVVKRRKTRTSWELKITGSGEIDPFAGAGEELVPAQLGTTEDEVDGDARASVDAKPKYKTVKKRMSKLLKQIKVSLASGGIPDEVVVRAFFEDCHLITTYRGKGDTEEYRLLMEYADALRGASEAADRDAMNTALLGLKERERACHDKYK